MELTTPAHSTKLVSALRAGILILCFFSMMASYGQIRTLGFKVKAGYSLSAQSSSMFSHIDYWRYDVSAFYVGASYEKPFSLIKNSAISFGLDFTKKGFKTDIYYIYDDPINTKMHFKWNYDLYYVELPIIVRTSIKKIININYGIVPAGLIYNKYNYLHSYSSSLQQSQSSFSKTYNYNYARGYDVQINIGLSKDISERLTVEANIRRGFINQNKQFMGDVGFQNFFMFGLTYTFKKINPQQSK